MSLDITVKARNSKAVFSEMLLASHTGLARDLKPGSVFVDRTVVSGTEV